MTDIQKDVSELEGCEESRLTTLELDGSDLKTSYDSLVRSGYLIEPPFGNENSEVVWREILQLISHCSALRSDELIDWLFEVMKAYSWQFPTAALVEKEFDTLIRSELEDADALAIALPYLLHFKLKLSEFLSDI